MSDELTTKQILIKDKAGKFKVARVQGGNDEGRGAVKPIRTTFDIPSSDSSLKSGVVMDKQPNSRPSHAAGQLEQTKSHQAPANFYFSVDDEEEVKRFKGRKFQSTQQQLSNIIKAYAQAVLDKSMLEDLSLGLKRRLLRVIESRLRDIRDLIETKEVLQRSIDLGGIGLDSQRIKQLIRLIEQERAGIEELAGQARDFKESEVSRDALSRDAPARRLYKNISLRTDRMSDQEDKKLKIEKLESEKKDAGPEFIPVQESKIKPETGKEDKKIAKQSERQIVLETEKSNINRRVIGPVEELGQITIEEFRKLGTNLEESVEKVVNKLQILEEESVNERAKGLAAWRRSPVYKMYLNIGQQSIAAQKSVEQYIRESMDKDKLMSFEEFEAIADLNKRLSF